MGHFAASSLIVDLGARPQNAEAVVVKKRDFLGIVGALSAAFSRQCRGD
jgi:hypothetical protein